MQEEVWKDIKGYEGIYQVSNFGNIKVVEHVIVDKKGVKRRMHERMKKPIITDRGYLNLALYKDNISTRFLVHRLVANAFLENPKNKEQVNHKDGIKTNNTVFVNEDGSIDYSKSNLEWASQSENMQHAFGNLSNKHLRKVMIVETGETFKSIAECARVKNLNQKCISDCINGWNKTHKNLHFVKVKVV